MSPANSNIARRTAELAKRIGRGTLAVIAGALIVVAAVLIYTFPSLGYIALHPDGREEEPVPFPKINSPQQLSTDGDTVVFRYDTALYAIDSRAVRLYSIPDGKSANEDFRDHLVEFSPDLSPDGSEIVYSTKRFPDGPFWNRVHNYDIAVSGIDGKEVARLPHTGDTLYKDTEPSWSPDGGRIAFISYRDHPPSSHRQLYVMNRDGTDVKEVAPAGTKSDLVTRPVWSPEGLNIAFRDEVRGRGEFRWSEGVRFVDVARVDGTGTSRIVESESHIGEPVWSPDGQSLAFIMLEGDSAALYTVAADGSNLTRVFPGSKSASPGERHPIHILPISWSPDGSEIRFFASLHPFDHLTLRGTLIPSRHGFPLLSYGLHSAREDGTGFRTLQEGLAGTTAWSSDGSRIAVYLEPSLGYEQEILADTNVVLYTSAPDGSDRRDLVQYVNGELVAENSGWRQGN